MTERNAGAIATNIVTQLKRIDIAMIAAAIVEVPRWYVAFAAIKEPWWAAVPMGILLAWGASAGWKAYFADRRRWLLLAINVTSLVGALVVIAPVLYAMTFTPLDEINLATVMSQELLMMWAATLAITTFIPLVQIAAVKMYSAQNTTAETPQEDAQDVDTTDAETPQTDATTTAQTALAQPRKRKATKRKPAKLTPEQRRAQVMESGITDAATIAAQFQVSMRTAQADIAATRQATLSTNGGAK